MEHFEEAQHDDFDESELSNELLDEEVKINCAKTLKINECCKVLKNKGRIKSYEREKFILDIEHTFREQLKNGRKKFKTVRQNPCQSTNLSNFKNSITQDQLQKYNQVKNNVCSMSMQVLKVNTKRDGFKLKSKSNIRTLDSPTLMLQLSQTLKEKKKSDNFKSMDKNNLIEGEESKRFYPIIENNEEDS